MRSKGTPEGKKKLNKVIVKCVDMENIGKIYV